MGCYPVIVTRITILISNKQVQKRAQNHPKQAKIAGPILCPMPLASPYGRPVAFFLNGCSLGLPAARFTPFSCYFPRDHASPASLTRQPPGFGLAWRLDPLGEFRLKLAVSLPGNHFFVLPSISWEFQARLREVDLLPPCYCSSPPVSSIAISISLSSSVMCQTRFSGCTGLSVRSASHFVSFSSSSTT